MVDVDCCATWYMFEYPIQTLVNEFFPNEKGATKLTKLSEHMLAPPYTLDRVEAQKSIRKVCSDV